ncbi:MAG: LytR/AlgR family response regulator transcription factor, partial [Steroidobacteraceae bacterium]
MRILIADDEPLARNRLASLCARQEDLDVVAQAESGRAAIDAIRALRPDVLLLDVELRDMTGFEVLRALGGGEEPLTIMVTAHPEHAAEAFDAEAIDYLTKPVDDRRFGAAIERARNRRAQVQALRVR